MALRWKEWRCPLHAFYHLYTHQNKQEALSLDNFKILCHALGCDSSHLHKHCRLDNSFFPFHTFYRRSTHQRKIHCLPMYRCLIHSFCYHSSHHRSCDQRTDYHLPICRSLFHVDFHSTFVQCTCPRCRQSMGSCGPRQKFFHHELHVVIAQSFSSLLL